MKRGKFKYIQHIILRPSCAKNIVKTRLKNIALDPKCQKILTCTFVTKKEETQSGDSVSNELTRISYL